MKNGSGTIMPMITKAAMTTETRKVSRRGVLKRIFISSPVAKRQGSARLGEFSGNAPPLPSLEMRYSAYCSGTFSRALTGGTGMLSSARASALASTSCTMPAMMSLSWKSFGV